VSHLPEAAAPHPEHPPTAAATTHPHHSHPPASADTPHPHVSPRPPLVWYALAAVIFVGCWLRFLHLGDVEKRSPDEDTYTDFAARIADKGIGTTPTLFAEFVQQSDQQNYPAPTRLTYFVLEAAVMRIAEIRDASAGVAISFILSCLSLVLLAWIGIRFFNPWVALSAVTFMAFSVGELAMARRAWQDSAFGFLGLLMMYVACEIASNPRRRAWYPAFLALGTLSLLTKQTGVIIYGVCGMWLLWVLLSKERLRQPAALLVWGSLASVVVTVCVLAVAAGGFAQVVPALKLSVNPGQRAIAYMSEYSSCPWYQFVYLLWITGPIPLVLAAAGAAVVVLRDRRNAAVCALLVTAAFVLFSSGYPLMQNLRYLSPANGAFCLLAGIGFCYLMNLARQRFQKTAYQRVLSVSVLVVMIGLFHDYITFHSTVVQPGILDLSVKLMQHA